MISHAFPRAPRRARRTLFLAAAALAFAHPAFAGDTAERRAALRAQIAALQGELASLEPAAAAADSAQPAAAATTVAEVRVIGVAKEVADRPIGQTADSVTAAQFARQPAFSISDVLVQVPGVTMVAGNGPRDVSISVRGSNARQTFGVRNVQVFEDGFPVTQPDGLARTDLTDPHAYGRIDVIKGPSSALYGNYATGGAIRFELRPGRELDGIEAGLDVGDDGYRNVYLIGGGASEHGEFTAFASHATGDGFRQHTGFRSTTFNGLATWALGDADRLTVKVVNNDTDANLSIRQSLSQFRQNPYQQGCERLAAAGCASLSLFVNGVNGARQAVSAVQAGSNRNDRRTIVGLRWAHDFAANLTGRVQLVWDNRDIKQPTGATSAVGTFPSYNLVADLTRTGQLAGRPTTLYGAVFYNTEAINSATYNVPASGTSTPGALTQLVGGTHANYGARARVETDLGPDLTVVAGLGVERTDLTALQTAYAYPTASAATISLIRGVRSYTNWAPEAAASWRVTEALKLHARLGGAYGTPQATNLFITPAGVPGNNTQLDSQTMVGLDVGAELRLDERLAASLTLFRESYRNELVSQSAGANLQPFTFNAPRSRHQGAELALDVKPAPGARLSLAYLHQSQTYRRYVERLSAGAFSAAFDRAGNSIPGVAPDSVNLRFAYDQPEGPLAGLGGYVEWNIRSDAQMDNANLLQAPGYTVVNLGARYDPPPGLGALSRLSFFLSVQNLADKVYVGSAGNISDSLNPVTGQPNGAAVLEGVGGSIYAGAPRSYVAGVRARF